MIYQEIVKLDPTDAQAILALANSNKSENNDASFLSALKPIF
jgi:hypothetical protein